MKLHVSERGAVETMKHDDAHAHIWQVVCMKVEDGGELGMCVELDGDVK